MMQPAVIDRHKATRNTLLSMDLPVMYSHTQPSSSLESSLAIPTVLKTRPHASSFPSPPQDTNSLLTNSQTHHFEPKEPCTTPAEQPLHDGLEYHRNGRDRDGTELAGKRKKNKSFVIWHDKHGELRGMENWIVEDAEWNAEQGPDRDLGHLKIDYSQEESSQDGEKREGLVR